MAFDPLFGLVSFEKAAKFIAICDLCLCVLYILSHFAGTGYVYEETSEKYDTEVSHAVVYGNDQGDNSIVPTPPNSTESRKPQPNVSYDELKKLVTMSLPSMDIMILLMLCMITFSVVHIILEVYLCRLLLKAATHKDGGALKTWFWVRLGITIMFTLYSLVGVMTVRTDVLDWFWLTVNLYRIYTLIIVLEFKTNISACNNVVKIPSSNNAQEP